MTLTWPQSETLPQHILSPLGLQTGAGAATDWIFMFPQIHVLKPNPQYNGMNGISDLIQRNLREFPHPLHHVRLQREDICL